MDADSLLAAWQRTLARSPDARALIDGASGRAWSRSELDLAARAWLTLLGGGVELERRRVLFAEPNGVRWFQVFLGLLHAGAVPVPADPTEPAENLVAIAGAIGAGAWWRDGSMRAMEPRPPAARRRDLCLIKLTSGSTGLPRARLFTHAQMLADGAQICTSMGIQETDLNLAVIPLGHSYGLGNLVVPLLAQGTPVLCSASPLPHALAADCARWRPTVFPAVPTLLRALAQADVAPEALGSLRLVISAGALLPPDVARAFAGRFARNIHSFYGSSETGGITYDRSGESALSGRGVGTPLDGVRLTFRRGGRFTVESGAVMDPGRFSPPDRARLAPDGELVLEGRTGRAIKIGGRRLDPAEVERALLALPDVRAACVLTHPERSDALASAVATGATPAVLRAALGRSLAPWKIPERIVVVDELPVTARGKIDRAAVLALLR